MYLDLFPLEDRSNAGVEGGAREHRGNRVGEVQDLLKVRGHVLQKKERGSKVKCSCAGRATLKRLPSFKRFLYFTA